MALNAEPLLLGIDIGGTKTAIVVGNGAAEVLFRTEFPSQAQRGPDAMLGDIVANARAVLQKYERIDAIGAVVGGPLDAEAGIVRGPPHLPGWDAVPLRDILSRALARPIAIEHDAKAGALAEWRFGAGRGTSNMVFLTLGTGLGAGLIVGGRLLRGAANQAGEIGHWRIAADGPPVYGKAGSLEGWASGGALPQLARFLHPDTLSDVRDAVDLSARAQNGDAAALATITRAGEALGGAMAWLIDLLAPEAIVLGALAARLGPTFTDAAQRVCETEALRDTLRSCRIVHAQLGPRAGDVASLCTAMEARPKP